LIEKANDLAGFWLGHMAVANDRGQIFGASDALSQRVKLQHADYAFFVYFYTLRQFVLT